MTTGETSRFCGNCDTHVSFEYPLKVFCSMRYEHGLDPVVDTLWHCEEWNLADQNCYCVEEALKAREGLRTKR